MKKIREKKIINVFIVLFLLMGLSSVLNHSLRIYNYYQISNDTLILKLTETKLDFELSEDDYIGKCYSKTMYAGVNIYLTDNIGENTVGRFYNEEATIVLTNSDIDAVAHEVSHFVDYVIKKKSIHDAETRAYLQGYFTDCVYSKVK